MARPNVLVINFIHAQKALTSDVEFNNGETGLFPAPEKQARHPTLFTEETLPVPDPEKPRRGWQCILENKL